MRAFSRQLGLARAGRRTWREGSPSADDTSDPGSPRPSGRTLLWACVIALFATVGVVRSEPYWFDFEFNDPNDLPQGEGWLRRYQPQPFGVVQDGVLTYDSSDTQTYDFWEYSRPGALSPGPDQVLLCEWRLWTEWVSYWGDPGISIKSDDGWVVTFVFDVDVIHSFHEYVDIPIPPGDWHAYTLVSQDMRTYELYVDGVFVRQGSFACRFIVSVLEWGDYCQGTASTHHWDYFRFGVVNPALPGDANCDTTVDFKDINPFVQALTDPGGYEAGHPGCPPENADINGDGSVDLADINPFVALLSS